MAKTTTATKGTPGTFDGDQPSTVGELEALKADPQEAWPQGTWVETTNGGKRYWDGEAWETGVAPEPEPDAQHGLAQVKTEGGSYDPGNPNGSQPEPEPEAEPEIDDEDPIVTAALQQRKMKAY